jgi:hypothetical protein
VTRLIKIIQEGDFSKTMRFFNRVLRKNYRNIIADYANRGIEALQKATPEDSGKTADSWNYEIIDGDGMTTLYFTNSNTQNGVTVAVLLIYGHGTRNGGYVEGIDFVTPALRPIFQELADKIWKEATE